MSAVKAHCSSDGLRTCLRLSFQGPSDGRSNWPKSFAEVNATFLFVKVNATPFVAFTLAINKK